MEKQLRETAKKLLQEGTVQVVIGYGRVETGGIGAIFVTNPDNADNLVWNQECSQNLVTYLTRKEIRKLGKAAIVVKACDARAVVVLKNESQLENNDVVVIGVACPGILNHRGSGDPVLQARCETCTERLPKNVDFVIGDESVNLPPLSVEQRSRKGNYAKLAKLMAMTQEERFRFWKDEFSRCIRCYACRQSCPLCYCNQCVVDKNRPVRIDTSATLKGNFAWNILRAFHLAGRCIGCGACSEACPAGIELDLLNLTLSQVSELEFHHFSGQEPGTAPLIGTYSEGDKEDFIQ